MSISILFLLAVSGGLSAWLPIILVIAAMLLFGIATFWLNPAPDRVRLIAGGLFCIALAQLIVMLGGL